MSDIRPPEKLSFFIGGYMGVSHRVEWNGAALEYQLFERHYSTKEFDLFVPSPVFWVDFWNSIRRIGVTNWKPHYEDSTILDGTHWKLELVWSDISILSEGSNEYPDGFGNPIGSSGGSNAMDAFCRALGRLLGGKEVS
ncbi:MAG: hypothetical protein R3C03_17775 [Pirellulaceae bacterium]